MSGEQIQVCEGWWRQRCGDVVRVKRNKDFPIAYRAHYPWVCKSYSYMDNGRMDSTEECDADLVEFLHDNETLEIWNSDSNGVTLTECLNLLCEHAERNLPEDWTIVVKFGRNESTIELVDPDGNDIEDSEAKSFDDYCDVANVIHRKAER